MSAKVQAGGGFVEDVQGAAGIALGQFERELDPLGLAAGESGGRLTELDITQTHIHQGLQFPRHHRHGAEERQRVFHGQVEHVVDGLALVLNFQGFPVVALAVADVAGHIDIRQEMHFDLDYAVALAGFAASALDVEGETARSIAARAGFGHSGEQLADRGEQAGIRCRVGTRACGRSAPGPR